MRRCAPALAGSALDVFGCFGAMGPWPQTGSKSGTFGAPPRPLKLAVLLAAQTDIRQV